jgi:hypothetical protein
MKDTHPQVKFDVFERLNTGAVKLSSQELRHGIYHGRFVDWLDKVGREKSWRELIGARTDKRMRAEEFVLRFLALHHELENYEKPLTGFLNNFMERHRDDNDTQLEQFGEVLRKARTGVESVFGSFAFKVFDRRDGDRIISDFNAALFDAEMLAISRARADATKLSEKKKKTILDGVAELFHDEIFQRSITLATSDVAQIRTRVRMVDGVVSSAI